MFGTLKRNGAGHESYSLELTSAPFSNQRQGSITRNACVRCRTRKAKCTGEAGGCQRCRDQNSECRYPNTQIHRFRAKNTLTNSRASEGARGRRSPADAVHTPAVPMSIGTTSGSEARIDAAESPILATNTALPPTPQSNLFDPASDFDVETFFDIDYGMEEVIGTVAEEATGTATPDIAEIGACGDAWPQMGALCAATASTTSTPGNRNLPPQPIKGSCLCALQAIQTHESIEIGLVFGLQYESGLATDILQRQKACLADCEALLRCQSCTARSEHVILILSMCDKIAYNMEDTLGAILRGGRRGDNKQGTREPFEIYISEPKLMTLDNLEKPSPLSYSQTPAEFRQRSATNRNRGCSPATTGLDRTYRGNHNQSLRSHGLQIGLWPLDDEDEYGVLRSLFSTRIEKLRSLLLILQDLAIEHNWPVHRKLVNEVRERFTESLSVI
ncbi:hypothetical protein GGR58DRAFT_508819 [Xylaria digitata]|nr:hypothetical protein GGR58DRAFT_508819 [Xylaria digitata]